MPKVVDVLFNAGRALLKEHKAALQEFETFDRQMKILTEQHKCMCSTMV